MYCLQNRWKLENKLLLNKEAPKVHFDSSVIYIRSIRAFGIISAGQAVKQLGSANGQDCKIYCFRRVDGGICYVSNILFFRL